MTSTEPRFDGRVAVVTGGGTGLGRAHARLLAAGGGSVVVNDIDADSAAETVRAIVDDGGVATANIDSVADEAGAAGIIDTALDEFGRLDVVLNNAGVLISKPFGELTVGEWDTSIEVGLTGSFLVSRAAWPHLVEQGSGRILFTTSNSGLLGTVGSAAYAAAKAGLWGLTRTLALEGASHGIAVNALAPMAYTAMSAQSKNAPPAWRDGTGDSWSNRLDVDRVSPVAAWLCHADCPLSGEILSAAGGRVARFFLGLTKGTVHHELRITDVAADIEAILDTADHDVLTAAFQEGRDLYRRLTSGRQD